MNKKDLPKVVDLVWSVLCSIKELGGSGTNIEIDEQTKKTLGLTEAHEVITYRSQS